MGNRGRKRRRKTQAIAESEKKQKLGVEGDDGTQSTNIKATYQGDEQYQIPSPLNVDDDTESTSRVRSLWSYFGKDKDWKPTAIQKQLWAVSLEKKKNVIGIAPTGSGKTLAYAIPTLLSGCSILILVPTRELTIQVSKVYEKLVKGNKQQSQQYKVMPVYGGVDRDSQMSSITSSYQQKMIIIATPGRLLDLLSEDAFPTSFRPGWIVLDEADQLSKDGDLGPQVDQILSKMKNESSTLALMSATYPETARERFETWINNDFVLLQVDSHTTSNTEVAKIPSHLKQVLHVCSEHKKPKKLMTTLQNIQKQNPGRSSPLGIVFFSRIEKVKYVSKLLEKEGISCIPLHSHLSAEQRTKNLSDFQSGKRPLLLATDVAARGLSINAVAFVIQYDFPSNIHQYVHRCGRAGRAGKESTVYSFFTRNLKALAADMISLLETSGAWVDPNLLELVTAEDSIKKTPKPASSMKRRSGSVRNESAKEQSNDDDEDDEFNELSANRIVLKRAGHVSDASSSSEEEGGSGDEE